MAENEMVAVPRAKVAELLGLPEDTDDATLMAAWDAKAAALNAEEKALVAAAAEAAACAEDRRIVNAAISDGRLPESRREFWLASIPKNREGNRAVIASLAPIFRPAPQAPADAELEAIHARVMRAAGMPTQLRAVAASDNAPTATGGGATPPPAPAARVDKFGFPIAGTEQPVVLKKGVSPADYTREQRYQDFAHKLAGKFALGVPRPPAGDQIYIPSPNDPYRWDAASGQFVEKNPYKEV
jgi:hypothetical protein